MAQTTERDSMSKIEAIFINTCFALIVLLAPLLVAVGHFAK